MAVLALAAGGAAIGSALGGGVLTSVGWAAGALLGQFLFPSRPSGGPQLGDLTVQSSAYGTPIPLIFGTVRVAGNIIWSPGIQARRQRQRFGKGGGSSATTYRYSLSFAVAFGEGPGQVVKLWLNDKLAFDATGGSLQVKVPGFRFRAYTGSETQAPDPLIVAGKSDGKAPAYRGTIYVVFEDLPLEQFGNQPPNVTALISTSVSAANTDAALSPVSGTYQPVGAADFSTRRLYLYTDRIVEVDYLANTAREVPNTASVISQKFAVFPGGPIVGQGAGANNTRPVLALDPVSGAQLWQWGAFSGGLTQSSTGGLVASGSAAAAIEVQGPRRRRFVMMESRGTAVRPLPVCLDVDTGTHIFGSEGAGVARLYEPRGGAAGKYTQGAQRVGETEAWHVAPASSPSEIEMWRLTFSDGAAWNAAPSFTTVGVSAARAGVVTAADLGFTSAGTPSVLAVAYDASDDSVIVFASWAATSPATQRFAFKWSAASGVVWRTPGHNANIPAAATEFNDHLLPRERIAYAGGSGTGVVLNTRTGEVEQSGALASHTSISVPRAMFDGDYDVLTSSTRRVLIGRVTAGAVPLSGIVQTIAGRAGLAPSDLALGALTDQVRGYVVSRQGSARDAIEPLAAAFLFDLVERDGQIAAVKRGGGVAASIAYADLLRPREGAGVLLEDRAQDRELPRALTVRYLDVERDYEPGAQTWQRPAAPVALSGSDARAAVDIAVPMTATEARTLARRLLMSAWRERNRVEFSGTPRHLRLDPADVLSVTRADGSAMRLRLIRADLGADYSMRFEAAEEDPADYALTAPGDAGQYFQNGMPIPYITRGFAPNLPLLADGDDMAQGALREYLLAGAYAEAWRGVEVSQSDDRVSWAALDPLTVPASWGAAANALPAPPFLWTWDDVNTLTVWMVNGEPESATDTEVLNGANLAALVTPTTGAVELVQWVNAAQNPDGSWALSRLLRGRRGTEDGSGNRAAGDAFIILDQDARLPLRTPPALLSATRFYRLRGLFDEPARATVVTKAERGRAERPYSPVQIAGTRDGSNNLTVTWVRRTRVGGELRDYSGVVPVSEASEAYEVEFLNGSTVVRTVTGLTSPTASYTAAQQTADGLTPGNPVSLRVYQMSALVGRGVPGSATV